VFAPVVAEAFTMGARGESYSVIADYLTDNRVPIAGNLKSVWQPYRNQAAALEPVYLGEARSGGRRQRESSRHSSARPLPPRSRGLGPQELRAWIASTLMCSNAWSASGQRGMDTRMGRSGEPNASLRYP
jgi:hypothetical protein